MDPIVIGAESQDGSLVYSIGEPVPAAVDDVVLACVGLPSIRGRITGLSEAELSNAYVRAFSDGFPENPHVREIPVDADGRFRITGVKGSVVLQGHHPARVPSAPVSGRGRELSEREVELQVGTVAAIWRIRVLRAGVGAGGGVPFLGGNAGSLLSFAETDRASWLAVAGDPARALTLVHEGLQDASGAWVTQRTRIAYRAGEWGGDVPGELSLSLGANPVFEVRAEGGGPAAGLGVSFERIAAGQRAIRPGVVDRSGRYRPATYAAVEPGRHRLALVDGTTVWEGDLSATGSETRVDVSIERQPIPIRVEDDQRRRITDDRFSVGLEFAASSEPGDVQQVDVRELGRDGSVVLFSDKRLGHRGRVTLMIGEWQETAELDSLAVEADGSRVLSVPGGRFASIDGHLRFPSGVPLAAGYAELTGEGLPTYEFVIESDGRVRHPWVVPGSYTLTVRFSGREQVVRRNLAVDAGRQTDLTSTLSAD